MAVCGCGQGLDGLQDDNFLEAFETQGILLSGSWPTFTVSAVDAFAWASYTPLIYNLTIGNGTLKGKFRRVGATLDLIIYMRFGSTSTWAAPGNVFGFDSPANVLVDPNTLSGLLVGHAVMGGWSMIDNSTANRYEGNVCLNATPFTNGEFSLRVQDDLGGTNLLMSQGNPLTLANLDELVMSITYFTN